MSKRHVYTLGPIMAEGISKTNARENAIANATAALKSLDRAKPVLVHWRGMVSLVAPTIICDGQIVWYYTNPRTVAELSADCGRERMGTAGYWESCSLAYSAALYHMIQQGEIPDELPDSLTPTDADKLRSLKQCRHAA